MQASLEAIAPITDAVLAALRASSALNALLDADAAKGVHDGKAPNPTHGAQPERYVVVRSPSTIPTGVFAGVGSTVTYTLDVVTPPWPSDTWNPIWSGPL